MKKNQFGKIKYNKTICNYKLILNRNYNSCSEFSYKHIDIYSHYPKSSILYCILYLCYPLLFCICIVCIIALNDKSSKEIVVINAANNIN